MKNKNKKIQAFYLNEVLREDLTEEKRLLNENSWFVRPADTGREYFSFFLTGSPEELKAELENYYQKKGVKVSPSFAKKLAELAFSLKDVETKNNTDLPDYIYIMH